MRFALLISGIVTFCQTMVLPGVIDTVGGTTYDNQNSGPSLQWLATDPEYGIHVTWMSSARPQGSGWPDRTMKYNFYDKETGEWSWIDPQDFMLSGMNSQSQRTGYGTLEPEPTHGAALIACHYNAGGMPPQFTPIVARDLEPGSGIFDYCNGAPNLTGYFLPVIATSSNETIHLLLIKFASADNLYYTRSTTWCNWENPTGWSQTGAFGHNIIASHESNTVLATWMTGHNDSLALNYRVSTDAGANWDPIQQLEPPQAYGGDTITVCATGASGLFDRSDNWVLVTTLLPAIGDTAYQNPAQLWIYNSRTSEWHRIHRAESHSLAGGFGSHAAICDRPSLGQNPETGRLYVAWEQFDSTNVEPSTNLLRAEIWLAYSDNGVNWTDPARLTSQDESSKRFPVIGRNCSGDSLAVFFEQDCIAGFNSDEVGAVSNNPICVWQGQAIGIREQKQTDIKFLNSFPNPGKRFVFESGTTEYRNSDLYIFDIKGKLVRRIPSQTGSWTWNGKDESGHNVQLGCYLASWRGRNIKIKLVVIR